MGGYCGGLPRMDLGFRVDGLNDSGSYVHAYGGALSIV